MYAVAAPASYCSATDAPGFTRNKSMLAGAAFDLTGERHGATAVPLPRTSRQNGASPHHASFAACEWTPRPAIEMSPRRRNNSRSPSCRSSLHVVESRTSFLKGHSHRCERLLWSSSLTSIARHPTKRARRKTPRVSRRALRDASRSGCSVGLAKDASPRDGRILSDPVTDSKRIRHSIFSSYGREATRAPV